MLSFNKKEFSLSSWKRINMRNITNLLGAEFIHDLYNRHLPKINSIRFRNTIIIWKNGVANSYAPKKEWTYLEKWLGEKFIKLDDTLITQIEALLNFDRSFINSFTNSLEKTNFDKLNNKELGLCLINLQGYTLGELYQVNLVQIEHSLTYAIKKILKEKIGIAENVDELLSKLIFSDELTESQKENLSFNEVVEIGRQINCAEPQQNKKLLSLIKKHHKKYAYMFCAYGESPRSLKFYFKKYQNLYSENPALDQINSATKKSAGPSELLKKINNHAITTLVPLMTKVGQFRDYNKSQLGQTNKYRIKILNSIAKRGLEKRDNLNYYLMSEILDLLDSNEKVDPDKIKLRKNNGVKLIRLEYGDIEHSEKFEDSDSQPKQIKGMCASKGFITGTCKIITKKTDAQKIKNGDIMVAIGTDFDLIDAIQKSAAVITEEGGLLSHASVVCRELSKPCCIGVENATKILKDDNKITLDATNGIITIN